MAAVSGNSITLTYHADSTYYPTQNPYKGYRTTWDPNQSEYRFSSSTENRIQHNLDPMSYFPKLFDYRILSSDSLPADTLEKYMADIYKEGNHLRIKELKQVQKEVLNRSHSEAYLQSLYFKYLNLSRYLLNSDSRQRDAYDIETGKQKHINPNVLEASMKSLPPHSPLWSLQQDLLEVYPEALGFTPSVISYLEWVSRENPDNQISGPVLLQLFNWSYDIEGNSKRTKEYYQQILDRFGNRYYARKAIEYVQENE